MSIKQIKFNSLTRPVILLALGWAFADGSSIIENKTKGPFFFSFFQKTVNYRPLMVSGQLIITYHFTPNKYFFTLTVQIA
jgi:hypothetical protein